MTKPTLTIFNITKPIRPIQTSIGMVMDGRFTRESALSGCSVVCKWPGPKWIGSCTSIFIYWHKDVPMDEAIEHALMQISTSRGELGLEEIREAFRQRQMSNERVSA